MTSKVIRDGQVRVAATGEIDLSNVSGFEKSLDEAAGLSPEGFIIDLTRAIYADSAAIQAILGIFARMQENGGRLAIVAGNPIIKAVLEVVHLEQLPGVTVCDTLDEALQSLPRPRARR